MAKKTKEEKIGALRQAAKAMGANCAGLEKSIAWCEKSGKKKLGESAVLLGAGVCGAATAASAAGGFFAGAAGLCLGYGLARSAMSSASAWRRAMKENRGVLSALGRQGKLFAINFKGILVIQAAVVGASVAAAGVLAGLGALRLGKKLPRLKKFSELALNYFSDKIDEKMDGFSLEKAEAWANKVVEFGSRGSDLCDPDQMAAVCYRNLVNELGCMAAEDGDYKAFSLAVKLALKPFKDCGAEICWRPVEGAMAFGELASFCGQLARKKGFEFPDPELPELLRSMGVESESAEFGLAAQSPALCSGSVGRPKSRL